MSSPLIVLRPEPGCSETLKQACARGLDAVASPLFVIEPVAWDVPDPAMFDGILAGSANAFRHGGAGLARVRSIPVHAVGERTAAAAREAGFLVVDKGEGGLQSLLGALSEPANYLRLAGDARMSLALPPHISLTERVVYRAMPQSLSGRAIEQLRCGAVVLLHSGEAGRHFALECERLGIDRRRVSIAALAPRIAAAAGDGWCAVKVAGEVSDPALLALAEDLCQ